MKRTAQLFTDTAGTVIQSNHNFKIFMTEQLKIIRISSFRLRFLQPVRDWRTVALGSRHFQRRKMIHHCSSGRSLNPSATLSQQPLGIQIEGLQAIALGARSHTHKIGRTEFIEFFKGIRNMLLAELPQRLYELFISLN